MRELGPLPTSVRPLTAMGPSHPHANSSKDGVHGRCLPGHPPDQMPSRDIRLVSLSPPTELVQRILDRKKTHCLPYASPPHSKAQGSPCSLFSSALNCPSLPFFYLLFHIFGCLQLPLSKLCLQPIPLHPIQYQQPAGSL